MNNIYYQKPILGLLLFFFLVLSSSLSANNIQVKNIKLTEQNNNGFVLVQFDLSWENSWRLSVDPANWDAAWVFVKFRIGNDDWEHASLNYIDGNASSDGHTEPPGATITTPSDGRGVFIYRSQDGSGSNDWKNIQLRWNYGIDGVGANDFIDVEVYALEMVYVPEGAYKLGGGNGNEASKFFEALGPINFNTPYSVESEATIQVGPSPGNLYYINPVNSDGGDRLGPIPADFPKGYQAFYCMKYEVTQYQWIVFFNSLNLNQKTNNDLTDLDHRGSNSIDRNTIDWDEANGATGATTESLYIPVTFPLWENILAYMDWAGLRPMTELEFVKACRGPLPVVPNEYAWGTPNIISTDFTYDLLNKYSENELLTNHAGGIGNANWINSSIFEDGPYRVGIFAASAKEPTREDVGATFWGIMEMSGNVSEMAVTIGTPEGRVYTGNHGDGLLDNNGRADVSFWPPDTGEGGGLFGGSWFSLEEELWINDRRSATAGNIGYFNDVGFRCVRTAPEN